MPRIIILRGAGPDRGSLADLVAAAIGDARYTEAAGAAAPTNPTPERSAGFTGQTSYSGPAATPEEAIRDTLDMTDRLHPVVQAFDFVDELRGQIAGEVPHPDQTFNVPADAMCGLMLFADFLRTEQRWLATGPKGEEIEIEIDLSHMFKGYMDRMMREINAVEKCDCSACRMRHELEAQLRASLRG